MSTLVALIPKLLSQMAPALTAPNHTDGGNGDAKLFGEGFTGTPDTGRPNLADSIFGELCQGTTFTTTGAIPLDHVVHVVGMGTKNEMANIEANGVVASVPDHETFRDRAIEVFPNNAVRALLPNYDVVQMSTTLASSLDSRDATAISGYRFEHKKIEVAQSPSGRNFSTGNCALVASPAQISGLDFVATPSVTKVHSHDGILSCASIHRQD